MGTRPRSKYVLKLKARRCPGCGAKLNRHRTRCPRCHQTQQRPST